MSKSKINKCRRFGAGAQVWFKVRRRRNRVKDAMAKASRKINR